MFLNIFGKRLLVSVRDVGSLFWSLIFPMVLATLFFAVFGGLDAAGMLNRFPLGVVSIEESGVDVALQTALDSVSTEDGLFELKSFADIEEADSALEAGVIEGYIIAGEVPTLVVTSDGINQTVAKTFLDRFIQTRSSIETIVATNPSDAANLPTLLTPITFTEEVSLSNNPPSEQLYFFYALMAMVSMYGCFQGLSVITYLQANLSPLGARRTMSPSKRWRVVIYDLLAGLTIQVASMVVLVAYITLVLGISFGDRVGLILLTCLVGSLLGVSFGSFVSAAGKQKEQLKAAILIASCMVCAFLAGLMVGGINYIIAERAPILSWINPAARIADSFYALYFYDTYDRFLLNIGVVLAMSIAMFLGTALFLRRSRYESI